MYLGALLASELVCEHQSRASQALNPADTDGVAHDKEVRYGGFIAGAVEPKVFRGRNDAARVQHAGVRILGPLVGGDGREIKKNGSALP